MYFGYQIIPKEISRRTSARLSSVYKLLCKLTELLQLRLQIIFRCRQLFFFVCVLCLCPPVTLLGEPCTHSKEFLWGEDSNIKVETKHSNLKTNHKAQHIIFRSRTLLLVCWQTSFEDSSMVQHHFRFVLKPHIIKINIWLHKKLYYILAWWFQG